VPIVGIPGLVAWYKATDLALNDNDPVSSWADASGNGYTLTGTTTTRPLYKTNVVNSLPAVLFDGVDDFLTNAAFKNFGDAYTIYAVISYTTSGPSPQAPMEISNGTVNTGVSFADFGDGNSAFRAHDASANRTVTGADYRDSTFRLHDGLLDGSTVTYLVNGTSVGTPAAYTSPNALTQNQIDLGRLTFAGFIFKGYWAELIVCNQYHESAMRAILHAYFASRFNLTIA
jgi:hypothetical protein